MSIHAEQDPKERVLGNDFALDGRTFFSKEQERRYFEDRIARRALGEMVWIVRNFDSCDGFTADLSRGALTFATLSHEYDENHSDVYITTGDGSVFGNETLCEAVSFEEAVLKAEEYANELVQ